MRYYTLTTDDVEQPILRCFGRPWLVHNFMGRVLTGDVGKRVYLSGDILQVENDEQRDSRTGGDTVPLLRIHLFVDDENYGWKSVELFDQDGIAELLANLAELIQRERIKRLLQVEVG